MVPKSSLQLVALCCVQVAAKCEETEELVPSLSKVEIFWLKYLFRRYHSKDGIGRVRRIEMVHGRSKT